MQDSLISNITLIMQLISFIFFHADKYPRKEETEPHKENILVYPVSGGCLDKFEYKAFLK